MKRLDAAIEVVLRVAGTAEPLGGRVLSDGTRLIGAIPHVGPDAWLHALFPGLREPELRQLEESLGGPLPCELREFYRRFNGLSLFNDALSIFGLRQKLGRTGDAAWQPFSILTPNGPERPPDSPPGLTFIGGYGWDGSLVFIGPSDKRVVRCLKTSSTPLNQWANLGEFLSHEAARLAVHFDDRGRQIQPTSPTVPPPSP